jgi:UDP-glucose 4-epimerase
VREALAAFESATGRAVEFEIADRRPGDIEKIYANVDKAERILDWRASRTIEDAFRDAWRWQQGLEKP